MAGAPLTQTQLPMDSILDINGKQTYLGNSFVLPTSGKSIANTVETPICVIQSASTNTKSLFLFSRNFSTDNNPMLFRYYLNPTINSPGSATVALNLKTGSTTTSVSICYLAMTITANGTLFETIAGSQYGSRDDLLVIIDPGKSILLTGQQSGAGTTVAIAEHAWYEI